MDPTPVANVDRLATFVAVISLMMSLLVKKALFLTATLLFVGDKTSTTSGLSGDSVRRLAPSVFHHLPVGVRRDLEARGCLVPQPWNRREPQNVIRGAFTIANLNEWAILCSVQEISQILIYRNDPSGTARVVDSLERSRDAAWLQGIGGGRQGYSRLIRTRQRRRLSGALVDVDGNAIPQPIDHDAIEQVFLEKATEGFYFAKGRWYRQVFAD